MRFVLKTGVIIGILALAAVVQPAAATISARVEVTSPPLLEGGSAKLVGARDDWPVGITLEEVDNDFLADSRDDDSAPLLASD